jgi:hypothetical protein
MPVKPKEPEIPSESSTSPGSSSPPDDGFVPPPSYPDNPEFVPPPKEPIPEQTVQNLGKLIVYGVDILHDAAASATGYGPWALTDKEREMWQYIAEEIVPHLPLKYAVLVVTAVILAISEGQKIAGYLAWERKKQEMSKEAGSLAASLGGP